MLFSQQVNIAFEVPKTCFWSCLLEITFRKKNLAYRYSLWFSPFQNVLFQGGVASMQMRHPAHCIWTRPSNKLIPWLWRECSVACESSGHGSFSGSTLYVRTWIGSWRRRGGSCRTPDSENSAGCFWMVSHRKTFYFLRNFSTSLSDFPVYVWR